jgi:hypothetical protein
MQMKRCYDDTDNFNAIFWVVVMKGYGESNGNVIPKLKITTLIRICRRIHISLFIIEFLPRLLGVEDVTESLLLLSVFDSSSQQH